MTGHDGTLTRQWSQPLGLPASPLSFQDLFSLDPEFLAFIPQPVRAVLLLFPQRGALAEAREQEERSGEGKFDGDVWWVKQTVSLGLPSSLFAPNPATGVSAGMRDWKRVKAFRTCELLTALQISNACGSIGLLHALLNLPEGSLTPGSKLVQFKAQSKDLDRE